MKSYDPDKAAWFADGQWIQDGEPCEVPYKVESSRRSLAPADGVWPIESDAAGVHPSQIEETRAHDAKHGVGGTDYTRDGRPILTDKSHRKRYLRAHGLHDNDGCYGD